GPLVDPPTVVQHSEKAIWEGVAGRPTPYPNIVSIAFAGRGLSVEDESLVHFLAGTHIPEGHAQVAADLAGSTHRTAFVDGAHAVADLHQLHALQGAVVDLRNAA